MFDNNLFLRSSGAGSLTATETTAAFDVGPTPLKGMAAVVTVPKGSIGDSFNCVIQGSTDGTTYEQIAQDIDIASVTEAVTTSRQWVRRFATPLPKVRAILTVAGTSPDYGAVTVAVGSGEMFNRLGVGNTITDDDETTVV